MEKKKLVAFDFDHTVIDDNSDLYVRKLAPGGKLPSEIKALYKEDGWTEYMAAIFAHLHEKGVTKDQILDCMREIKLVNGMAELFSFLEQKQFDVIIISDANSVFIDCILESVGLHHIVKKTYTNPAEFNEDGKLLLDFYHLQDWCNLSTKNLCKGHILDEYLAEQAKNGVIYDTVSFVGDGSNDLCPSLRLRSQDLVFPRKGFKLLKMINSGNEEHVIKGKVIPWESGLEIKEALSNK